MCIWTHAHTLCHMLLHCTCCSLHDCVWQQWSGTLNCCIMLVHHVTIYTYSLSDTHKHITLTYGQKGTCIIETSLQWKDMTSISFQMTVVIIRFSSPHHLYLHHLAPIPGSHIRIFETNTHTYTHGYILLLALVLKRQMHSRCTRKEQKHTHTHQASILS